MEWINGSINFLDDDDYLVSIKEIYQYVSVLLFSHTCGISFEKRIHVLSRLGSLVPYVDNIRWISENFLAYPTTGRRLSSDFQWQSKSDETRLLS